MRYRAAFESLSETGKYPFRTIQEEDVGKSVIRAFNRTWDLSQGAWSISAFRPKDVGRRIYDMGDAALHMETDGQMERRLWVEQAIRARQNPSLKKVHEIVVSPRVQVRVYKDSEFNEYQIRVYRDGKFREAETGFESTSGGPASAVATAHDMARRLAGGEVRNNPRRLESGSVSTPHDIEPKLVQEVRHYLRQAGLKFEMRGFGDRLHPFQGLRRAGRSLNQSDDASLATIAQRHGYTFRAGEDEFHMVKRSARANPGKPRKPRVNYDKMIPKAQIDHAVGKLHVGTPDAEVAATIRRQATKMKWPEPAIKAAEQYALKVHHRNLSVYTSVMTGRF